MMVFPFNVNHDFDTAIMLDQKIHRLLQQTPSVADVPFVLPLLPPTPRDTAIPYCLTKCILLTTSSASIGVVPILLQ